MKRNWKQMNSSSTKPTNYSYWNIRNGNQQNNLTQEETNFFKKYIQEKMNEEEINKQVQTQLEIERRIKDLKKAQNMEESNQIEIVERELSLAKKEIKKLKDELEQSKEECEKWKRKYKTLVTNSKEDTSSTDEELEKKFSSKDLEEELKELIKSDITKQKIKKLGAKKLEELCDKYGILYRNMDQASRLLFEEIGN